MSVTTDPVENTRSRAAVDARRVRRAPAAKPSSHGPQFFMPGSESGPAETERCYETLRETVGTETGLSPRARRIFSISCRYKGSNAVFEVGQPVPGGAGSVLAILDVGGDQPYCVRLTGDEPPLRLGKRLYALTEFRAG